MRKQTRNRLNPGERYARDEQGHDGIEYHVRRIDATFRFPVEHLDQFGQWRGDPDREQLE